MHIYSLQMLLESDGKGVSFFDVPNTIDSLFSIDSFYTISSRAIDVIRT